MATRRCRIKGIANIPQRRKAEPKVSNDSTVFLKPEPKNKDATESPTTASEDRVTKAEVQNDNNVKERPSSPPSQSTTNSQNDLPRRRNIIKPKVNRKLFQRPKVKIDDLVNNHSSNKQEILIDSANAVSESEIVITPGNNNSNSSNPPIQDLNETVGELSNIYPTSNDNVRSSSDTESTVGLLSPTKVNRSRIKAVPRLSHRRTSMTVHGSASESEDDGKRNYKRIRTESASSSISVNNEPQVLSDAGLLPQKSKEFSTIIQRKCKRTEQSRRMAEARRHFQHKFANQVPDKQKLTMMDLIFYNPINNPMSQKPKKKAVEEAVEEVVEDADDIVVSNEEAKTNEEVENDESDEENTIPAPQIKIGPNGEIVIDEKSLIIENEETKRNREEIQKSKIINGDFDTGYGVYKREKRAKDWSTEETLRFYKALNTIGTDFTLMLELFKGRSRRELKMKFKKEERVNRTLIDKAIKQPAEFDITDLRVEAESQWKEKQMVEKQKTEIKRKIRGMVPYIDLPRDQSRKRKPKMPPSQAKKRCDIYSALAKGISSICTSNDDEKDDSEENPIEATEELVTKPTHSGCVPRREKPYTSQELPLEKIKKLHVVNETENAAQDNNNSNNLNMIQPGSIMMKENQMEEKQKTKIKRKLCGSNRDQSRKKKRKMPPSQPNKYCDTYSTLENGVSSICTSDDDEDDSEEEEDPIEVTEEPVTKPTRSGRVPRRRKLYTSQELPLDKIEKSHVVKKTENAAQDNSNSCNLSTIQPGSVMIVASETPSGEPTFKVFMVTSNKNKVQITLDPDVLNSLTQNANYENYVKENTSLPADYNNKMSIPDDSEGTTSPTAKTIEETLPHEQ